MRTTSIALYAVLAAASVPPATAQQATVEQLQHDLETMKRQFQQLQEQMQKQEKLIQQLSAEKHAAPADEERVKRDVTDGIMRRIQPSLAAANKTFASQFNPSIGLVVDTVGSYGSHTGSNFSLRAAEIGIAASVDPFARAYAILNGNQEGFEVEEAAIVTTSLPYSLTLQGGRFFADFGRLSKFHDHDLPFVNRPVVLDEYVDGESQAEGVQLSWLAPLSQYVNLTAGWYNKIGADNERVSNVVPRDLSEFTYLGRAATFFSLTDANNVDLGVSLAGTPKVVEDGGTPRYLGGVDLTYRWIPLSEAGYRGFTWGTEVLYNQEHRPIGGFANPTTSAESRFANVLGASPENPIANPTPFRPVALPQADGSTPLVFRRRDAVGLYSYAEYRLSRRFYAGFLFDWAQDINPGVGDTFAYSPYLTVWASEFQRFRLQYTRFDAPGDHENQFFLQWTVIIGSHVHSFRDR